MCLLVVDTALGLAALLLGVALVELGLRGDGRPWHGGAVTAADMASSSSLRKNQEKDLDRAALVALSLRVEHAGQVRCLIGSGGR